MRLKKLLDNAKIMYYLSENDQLSAVDIKGVGLSYTSLLKLFQMWTDSGHLKQITDRATPNYSKKTYALSQEGMKMLLNICFYYLFALTNILSKVAGKRIKLFTPNGYKTFSKQQILLEIHDILNDSNNIKNSEKIDQKERGENDTEVIDKYAKLIEIGKEIENKIPTFLSKVMKEQQIKTLPKSKVEKLAARMSRLMQDLLFERLQDIELTKI